MNNISKDELTSMVHLTHPRFCSTGNACNTANCNADTNMCELKSKGIDNCCLDAGDWCAVHRVLVVYQEFCCDGWSWHLSACMIRNI